jgi:CRP-like cAMP-binding protein
VRTVDHGGGVLRVLAEDDRRVLLATMTTRHYLPGDVLFHEGEAGDSLFLIERGRVAVRVSTAQGDVATVAVLGPGDSLGEQALLADAATRTAGAVALERVEVRTLRRRDFDELRETNPAVDRVLVDVLAAQVRRLSSQLVEALYLPVEQRLVRRLAELVALYRDGAPAGLPLSIPLRQEDLASLAGTTRPTANRVLRQLAVAGVITLRRGGLDVLDADALAARAG